jgi:hypothetical protein
MRLHQTLQRNERKTDRERERRRQRQRVFPVKVDGEIDEKSRIIQGYRKRWTGFETAIT